MKNFLTLLLFLVLTVVGGEAFAQNKNKNFSKKQYKQDLESFIITSTGMSALDAKNFFPLYHELHDKQREINQKIMKLKRMEGVESPTGKDYKAAVDKITDLKVEFAELEKTYYRKMCKVVSPKKVHTAMLAEDRFHRKMLQKMPYHKPCPYRAAETFRAVKK